MDVHGGLAVGRGAEDFAALGRDGGIAVDQPGEDAAEGFDAQRQRGHVEQHHVVDFLIEHAALDGRAAGHDFVRIDALVGLFVEDVLGFLDHRGHTGHTADHDHFIDLGRADAGVLHTGFAGFRGAGDQAVGNLFELGTGQGTVQMDRAILVHGNERQVDFGAHAGGKFALGLFRGFFQALEGLRVFAEVHAGIFLEIDGKHVDQRMVEVVAAEVSVAVGGFHFENAVAEFEDRDIERTAAEVVDRDGFIGFLVQAVGQ